MLSFLYLHISIYSCTCTHTYAFLSRTIWKANHEVSSLNTSLKSRNFLHNQNNIFLPKQSIMLIPYFKLINSLYSGSLNCSKDVLYRFYFQSGSQSRTTSCIWPHLVSFYLGQSLIILSFRTVTLLKSSGQLAWSMSRRGCQAIVLCVKVNLLLYSFILCD